MASTGLTAPKQIANQKASALHANSSVSALVVHSVDQDGNYVSPGAGSTQVSIKEILTSSGASVIDSTNNAIGVTIRAGSAAGTEYTDGDVDGTISGSALLFDNSSNTLRPVTLTRGLPVNVVAGAAGGSTQVSVKQILDATGASVIDSTAHAVIVTNPPGSAVQVNITSAIAAGTNLIGQVNIATPLSSAVANSGSSAVLVRVVGGVSSAVDFQARVNQGVGNSSAADRWRVNAANSSAADFLGTRLVDSSGTGFHGPTNPLSIQHRTSSGALMDDSTNNALRVNVVAGSAAGSTVVSVSQLLDSSGGTISAGDNVNQAIRVNVVAGAAGGSTQVSVKEILTSSGGSVMDGTNVAIRVNVVAGSAAGSTETLSRLGDRDQSSQVAAVLGAAPASTTYGLVTRDLSTGPYVVSSVGGVVTVSTGPSLARLTDRDQSTQVAAILGVAPVSTTYGLVTRDLSTGPYVVSSVGGVVNVSTGPFVISSVGGVVTVSTGPFAISSIAGPVTIEAGLKSTASGSSNSTGLLVRPILENLFSVASTNAFASTTLVISQNVAGQRCKVYGYSITSTVQAATTIKFYGGSTMIWPLILGSISSAVTGANVFVDPPGYLFAGDVNSSVSVRVASSIAGFKVGIAYFMAP